MVASTMMRYEVNFWQETLLWSYAYPKFGRLENTLMGGMAKALVDQLSIDSAVHAHDA